MVRPMLSDRYLSCLSVTLVYFSQTVGQIKMKLGVQAGLDPGHIVLDGDPALPLPKGGGGAFQFAAHICCGQMAAWIKMPLGTEVDLGPGDFVLDGDLDPPFPKRGRRPPKFPPIFILAKRLDGSRWYLARR